MRKYRAVPTDLQGNAQPSATYTVKDAGTSNLTTLFDEDEATHLANPGTANSNGEIIFRVPDGTVVDITVSKSSSSFARTFTGISIGGGGGGREYHARYDFGALGDDANHALSSGEAALFNTKFGSYGLVVVAGDFNDWAALQAMLLVAASTGRACYIPTGIYHTNKPLNLAWTATPATGATAFPKVTKIYGDGYSSQIKGTIASAGRAVLELIGEDNGNAANCEVAHLRLSMSGGSNGAYCLRVGDCWTGIRAHRVSCEGANGLLLKVASSVSYANLNTVFDQCRFMANYGYLWWADNTLAEAYALSIETGGSYWDNVRFASCIFGNGVCDTRAFIQEFDNCQFYTDPARAAPWNQNINCSIGSLHCDNCYFEDHDIAIVCVPYVADIRGVCITNSHFTGLTNFPVGSCKRAIVVSAGPNGDPGPVIIEGNKLGSTTYVNECIQLIGVCARVGYNTNIGHIGTAIRTDYQFSQVQDSQLIHSGGNLACVNRSTFTSDTFQKVTAEGTANDAIHTPGGVTADTVMVSPNYHADRVGNGSVAAATWGFSVSRADALDYFITGWSSNAYTTGGPLPWLPNNQPFTYLPTGSSWMIGFGTQLPVLKFAYNMVSSPGGYTASSTDYTSIGNVPQTLRFTINHTQLALGATSNVITLFQLQPGQYVLAAFIKHSAAFTGGSLSAYTLALGNNSIPDKYATAFDVWQAPGNSKIGANGKVGMEDGLSGAAQNVQLTATSVGSTLSAATGGVAELWIVIGKLPS